MAAISPRLCVRCKGRLWCGPVCYIAQKQSNFVKATSAIDGTSFRGSSPPGVFVSWHNYPDITVAPLSPPQVVQNASFLDSPEKWFGLSTEKIISMREQLIQSRTGVKASAASNPSRFLSQLQELFMSSGSVDVSVELKKKPRADIGFSDSVAPLGPKAELKKIEFNENPRIERKVDYLVSDTDAKSFDALKELYGSDFSVSFISKLLSSGLLGVKKQRKFVPTRWSITATDSNISQELVESKVKDFAQLGEVQVFSSSYLDNHFFILLVPGVWGFEQLEAWHPGAGWALEASEPVVMSDHEFFLGKKGYASNVAGAYYASRLAVAEHLVKIRRQAAVVVFREIGQGYAVSLGVWVIREAVRNALKQNPLSFSDTSLALKFIEKRLAVPIKFFKEKSAVLDSLFHQKRLSGFLGGQQ